MTDYIDRESALNASKIVYIEYIELDGEGYEDGNADDIPVVFKKDIEAIPAADVKPVVRGEWIKLNMHRGMEQFKCSVCMQECYVPTCMEEPMYSFCPNCGAEMREKENE